jgi:isopentenyl diphosphate isomerase/L-lactate dehydrogenase-like FMN-dependent dehydrogenase
MLPAAFETTTEMVRAAHELLSPPHWDYVVGGAETESTVLRNRQALNCLVFRARILRNVGTVDTSTTLLGTPLRIPYILAPVGFLGELHPEGAAAAVRAAAAFGTLPVVGGLAKPELEVSARASSCDKWYQLYLRGDPNWSAAHLRRVRDAGYRALVVTADVPYFGNREHLAARRWFPAGTVADDGIEYQALLDWDGIDRLREQSGLPLVLKGIQCAEDAVMARERGIDALWVSNHGGRQLDHAKASVEVLREVVAAVGNAVPIIVDGGFLRGTDILKAVALGATAVATGRLQALSLAVAGEAGVVRMLQLVEAELRTSMALLGTTRLGELDASYVETAAAPLNAPGAFPFLPPEIRL